MHNYALTAADYALTATATAADFLTDHKNIQKEIQEGQKSFNRGFGLYDLHQKSHMTENPKLTGRDLLG